MADSLRDASRPSSSKPPPQQHPSPSSPAPKRRRISRACLQCRTRKIKCNGKEPACANCAASGQTCTYTESKRRGLPPGYVMQLETYIRALEILLGSSLQEAPDIAVALSSLVNKLAKDRLSVPSSLTSPSNPPLDAAAGSNAKNKQEDLANHHKTLTNEKPSSSSTNLDAYKNKWLQSQLHSEIRAFAASLPAFQGTSNIGSHSFLVSPYCGCGNSNLLHLFANAKPTTPTAIHVPLLDLPRVSISSVHENSSSPESTSFLAGTRLAFPRVIKAFSPDTHLHLLLSWIQKTPFETKLAAVNTYIRAIHSWLPLCDPQTLFLLARTTSSQQQKPLKIEDQEEKSKEEKDPSASPPDLFLLAAILTTHQNSTAKHSSNTTTPNNQSNTPSFLQVLSIITSPLAIGDSSALSRAAQLSHIHSHFILTLGLVARGLFDDAWAICGLAVRATYVLGLNSYPGSYIEKRTWYAACILDTLLATVCGRIPHISDSGFGVSLLIPPDYHQGINSTSANLHDSQAPDTPTYNALFSLIRILNNILFLKNSTTNGKTTETFALAMIPAWIESYGQLLTKNTSEDYPNLLFHLRLIFVVNFELLGNILHTHTYLHFDTIEEYILVQITSFNTHSFTIPFLGFYLYTITQNSLADIEKELASMMPLTYAAFGNDPIYPHAKKPFLLSKRVRYLHQILDFQTASVLLEPSQRIEPQLLHMLKTRLDSVNLKVMALSREPSQTSSLGAMDNKNINGVPVTYGLDDFQPQQKQLMEAPKLDPKLLNVSLMCSSSPYTQLSSQHPYQIPFPNSTQQPILIQRPPPDPASHFLYPGTSMSQTTLEHAFAPNSAPQPGPLPPHPSTTDAVHPLNMATTAKDLMMQTSAPLTNGTAAAAFTSTGLTVEPLTMVAMESNIDPVPEFLQNLGVLMD